MSEQGKGNGLFRIGEVAKLFHLSISSLRHYETIGLVQPEYTDEMTGYRYYSVRQFEALNTIRYLRALDVGLKDIRGFLQHKDLGCMEELLEAQQRTVRQKLAELARIERKVGNRLAQLQRAQSAPLDEVRLEQCPAQRMIFLRADLQQPRSQDLEAPIRQLEAEQQEALLKEQKEGSYTYAVLANSIRELKDDKAAQTTLEQQLQNWRDGHESYARVGVWARRHG